MDLNIKCSTIKALVFGGFVNAGSDELGLDGM